MVYVQLFLRFFKIGFLTFGGGLSMLPTIRLTAIRLGWVPEKEWGDLVTLAQLFPGAIAVNIAHLIGYRVGGRIGSIVSVLSMVLPSFLIILLLATIFQPYLNLPAVEGALKGILMAVSLLLLKALIELIKPVQWTIMSIAWVLGSFAVVWFNVLSPLGLLIITFLLVVIQFSAKGLKR
jgi:chromate transporter